MKRAVLILIAALLVLLVYPSTHPFAKSLDRSNDGPIVITPYPGGPPIALTDSNDDDSDDGDADGVAGNPTRGDRPVGTSTGSVVSAQALLVRQKPVLATNCMSLKVSMLQNSQPMASATAGKTAQKRLRKILAFQDD